MAANDFTSDTMRKVVAEEGLEARNLLNWNVIVSEKGSLEVPKSSKKPPFSPRPQSTSPKPPLPPKDVIEARVSKRCLSLHHPKSRIRSSSVGRNPEKSLRARYWAFLFENLYRAVDEIYQTCEMDESIAESKEAIMMLENYCKEFQALIQWLNISKNYEVTPPPNRPTSLAWEVRKSLPSKGILKSAFLDKIVSGSTARRKSDPHGDFISKSIGIQTELKETISNDVDHLEISSTSSAQKTDNVTELCRLDNKNHNAFSSPPSGITDPQLSLSKSTVPLNQIPLHNDCDIETNGEVEKCISTSSSSSLSVPDISQEPVSSTAIDSNELTLQIDDDIQSKSIPSHLSNSKILIAVEEISNSDGKVDLERNTSNAINSTITQNAEKLVNDSTTQLSTLVDDSVILNNSIESSHELNSSNLANSTLNEEKSVIDLKSANNNIAPEFSTGYSVVPSKVGADELKSDHSNDAELKNLNDTKSAKLEETKSTDLDEKNFKNSDDLKLKCVEAGTSPTLFIDAGIQTLPTEKYPAGVLYKSFSSTIKTKSSPEIKVVNTTKKTTVSTQSPRTQNKPQSVASATSLAHTNNSANLNQPAKEVNRRPISGPNRFVKSTNLASHVAKNAPTASANMCHRKPTANSHPTQDYKPFRTGNYEPKFHRTSQVSTTASHQKHGIRKVTGDAAPSHMSRPSQHHIGKDTAKSESMSSLSSTSSAKSWAGKAKDENCRINKQPDDADGWETVRGRTRCKNSPAKKIVAQSAVDTALVAKFNQCKMGGFVYNCTSNSKAATNTSKDKMSKHSKSVQDLCSIKEDSKQHSDANDIASLKTNTGNKMPENKTAAEASKTKKKVVDNSKSAAETRSKTGSGSKTYKNIPKTTEVSKQANKDKKQAINSPNFPLRKSYSSCSIDIHKKNIKSSSQKVPNDNLKINSINHSESNISSQDNCKLMEKENIANKSVRKQQSDSLPSLTADEKNERGDAEKNGDINNAQSSDSDETLTAEDLDGMISQDEGLSESQKLELYNKMIQEEAQEDISALSSLSWGDQMDLLDMDLRTPGRALHMHEKLSSPFRKRPISETIRLQEEKQLKAQEQRERLLGEKAQRFKDIQRKVEEMKAFNEKKAERQRIILEQKLQRAEEKRKKQIEMIVKKAHDEEEKVNEIAFINTLEAQNKRHDLISKEKDHEARLHDIQEERQRKLEEKAAKEAAAEERRKILEAERQARLLEMQEKRKLRDLKIEQQLMEKEKERQELANQKARERELRISALNAAQQATVEELQKKIQLKQEESARRHDENMAQIRQKAFELSVRRYSSNNDDAPQLVPYETKKICTICNVLIGSEVYLLSHLRGKKHQAMVSDQHHGQNPSTEELEQYNLKHIVDASTEQLDPNIALDRERQKALKKRCKKLRQRLEKRAQEFEKNLLTSPPGSSSLKIKTQKLINDMKRFSSIHVINAWDESLNVALDTIISAVKFASSKFTNKERIEFRIAGGLATMIELLNKIISPLWKTSVRVPKKTINQMFDVIEFFLRECYENCVYTLLSNKIGQALDVLGQRLNVLIPDNFNQILINSFPPNSHAPPMDEISGELMLFLGFVLNYLSEREITVTELQKIFPNDNEQNLNQKFETQITDIVSYAVSLGIIDRLSQYFINVRGSIDSEPEIGLFVRQCLTFLTSLMKFYCDSYDSTLEKKKIDDATQFIATLKVTELVGVVSLLYCILLHDGSSALQETPPPKLPSHTIVLTLAALRMLNQIAVMNLHLVQTVLGSEGLSLQLRHIASYLLWYCNHWKEDILLHELILLLGYFTVSNPDNQALIQAGQSPTVLQQLCALPFVYFSHSTETEILFPTLIACSYNNECNRTVLKQEMSIELLSTYLEAKLLDGYSSMKLKNDPNIRWYLHTRFPKYQWSAAKLYFLK